MAVDITMPRLSDSMEEGTVAKWHVSVGSAVERGQVLAEIDTDKATMEYEAETRGTVLAILVREGETAAVGVPIAILGEPGEAIDERMSQPAAPAEAATQGSPASTPPIDRAVRENASPVARRLATELGVDLAALSGTGPGGLITKEDVQQAASAAPAHATASSSARGDVRVEALTRVQEVIARRMTEGSSVPTFAVDVEIDVSALAKLRAEQASADATPSLNDYVVRAVALALREFARLNGSFAEAGFELYSRVNVGIAVAAEGALLVPVVFDADAKSVLEIGVESRRLAGLARTHDLAPADLDGGTFTVTNLGMFGTSRFLPIVNPPQAGILAVGAATRRPAFDEDGSVVPREILTATLVCDHRIVYGAEGARFLARLRELLEDPGQL
jgi:pyruvate dehydrogenase E2 component (dihydrolipoamide acetyltransferase)